jgi:hypothetical protein
MTIYDKTLGVVKQVETPLDPATLDFIERISYFERLRPVEADNDNAGKPESAKGSACFDSWAKPEFMRR